MSQYGADGYAEHGKSYQFILAHYYQGTSLGSTDPDQIVRVLLATGSAAFAEATAIAGEKLDPSLTYTVAPLANGQLAVFDAERAPDCEGAPPLDRDRSRPARRSPDSASTAVRSSSVRTAREASRRSRPSGSTTTSAAWSPRRYPRAGRPQALEAQAVAARTYAITTDVAGGDLQPVSGHALADVRRRRRGDAGDRRRGRRDAGPGRHVPRRRRSSPTSSAARAATRRASRTYGRERRPSRGCAGCPTRTTSRAAIPTTAGDRR